METELQFEQFRDQYNAWLRDTIHRHGWAVQPVLGDGDEPDYAYTIGLTTFDHHPELMITGVCDDDAGRILTQLGTRIRHGARLHPNQTINDLEPPIRFHLLTLDSAASDELLIHANARYQHPDGPPVPGYQVVWSDDAGNMPWHPTWNLGPDAQLLAAPPPVPHRDIPTDHQPR